MRRAFGRKVFSCFAAAMLAASLAMPSLAVAAGADGNEARDSAASEMENLIPDEAAVEFEGASDDALGAGGSEGGVVNEGGAADGSGAGNEDGDLNESADEDGTADGGGMIDEVLPLASSSTTKVEGSGEPKSGGGSTLDLEWNLDGCTADVVSIQEDGSLKADVDQVISTLAISASVAWTSSGDEAHPAGSVEIRVPDHLFLGRDGEPWKGGTDGNGHYIRQGLTVRLGVPQAPSASADGWQYTRDKEAGAYVITNARDVAAGTKFVCEVSYSYSASTYPDHDPAYDPDRSYRCLSWLSPDPVRYAASLRESNTGLSAERELSASIETHSDLAGVEAEAAGLYMEWQDAWGERPADSEGYYYAVWRAEATGDYLAEPYELEIAVSSELGEVVGATHAWFDDRYRPDWAPELADPATAPFADGATAASSWHDRAEGFRNSVCGLSFDQAVATSALFLARYPKESVPTGEATDLDFRAEARLMPADHAEQAMAAEATAGFTPVDFTAIPGDSFSLYSNGVNTTTYIGESYNRHSALGQLDSLASGERTAGRPAAHALYASAYASTLGEGLDPADPGSYGKRPYRVELVQDMAYLNGTDSLLDDGDLEVTRVLDLNEAAVTLYEPVADPSTGSLSGRAIEGAIVPLEVTVSAKIDGAWIPVASWTQTESGRIDPSTLEALHEGAAIAPYDEAEFGIAPNYRDNESAYDGQQRYDLEMPEGATGAKLSFETSAFAASVGEQDSYPAYGFVPVTALNPTDAVMEAAAGKSLLSLYSLSTLAVRNADGSLVGLTGSPSAATPLYQEIEAADRGAYGSPMYHRPTQMGLQTSSRSANLNVTLGTTANDASTKTVVSRNNFASAYIITRSSATLSEQDAPEALVPQKEATFRLLIPKGASLDTSSLFACEKISNAGMVMVDSSGYAEFKYDAAGNRILAPQAEIVSVEVEADWRGSGRDLATVRVAATSEDAFDSGCNGSGSAYPTNLVSGFLLNFSLTYPWDSIADYGSTLRTLVAYEGDGGDLSTWGSRRNEAASDINASGWSGEEKELMTGLDPEGSANAVWKYASVTQTLNYPTSAEYGLGLSAKAAVDASWIAAGSDPEPVTAYAGQTYQYRIRTALEEGSTSTGNVIFDPLECYSAAGAGSGWRGTLENVDVSQIRDAGADPVVHYSTVPNLDVSLDENRDLSNEAIWSTEPPADMADATAVAVDCSKTPDGGDFELPERGSLVVVLTMRAPTEGAAELAASGACALNQAWLASTVSTAGGSSSSRLLHNEHTKVGIGTVSFEFLKADSEGISTGSQGTAEVDGDSLISGARFALYRATGSGASPLVDPDDPAAGGWEQLAEAESDPWVSFEGLAPGEYRLVEVRAAEGYATPKGQWNVTLDPMLPIGAAISAVEGEGGAQPPAFARSDDGYVLANVALASIPVTGGAGNALLAAAAGVAAIAAGSWLHARNRRARRKEG